ncbi:Eukaryotic aspartyl protease [Popillia japonica]|uniref:Eukaryotic aspartyl protease n=1 Tax=Popillia japonica TaxID=7064 RepID=A0AAW1LDI2_POPJA
MRYLFVLSWLLFLFCIGNTKIVLDLFRQETPRQSILKSPNIPEHGIWIDWLKESYEKKKNYTRTNDTIPLLRFLDTEFYALIGIGSPGKPMKVIFDTAWSTTWMMSNDCPIKPMKVIFDTAWSTTWMMSNDCPIKTVGCWFHNKYDHKHSSKYVKDGRPYNNNEGTYNLTGYYSRDELKIAHTVINQTFVEMTSVPYWYIFTKADGVVGLGLPQNDINPFLQNVLNQTNITKPIFSIYLNRDKSSKKGGSIILGAIDKKHIHVTNKVPDKITYVPINSASALWEFSIDRIFFEINRKIITICENDCTGLADTSTNSVITAQNMLSVINEQISAKPFYFGKYQVECDIINKLPALTFVIGGNMFNLTGPDYTQKLSIGPFTTCISAFTAATTVSEQKRWVLGGAFLARYYSIYDIANKRMGLVRAA